MKRCKTPSAGFSFDLHLNPEERCDAPPKRRAFSELQGVTENRTLHSNRRGQPPTQQNVLRGMFLTLGSRSDKKFSNRKESHNSFNLSP
jgi:hypothetical protein